VVKPVKPVAAISRFAKIKNTQPWYQNFNLVVSPEFSGNHFSGEEGEVKGKFYRRGNERTNSVQAMLGGQIKSTSIYARVGYAKTDYREMLRVTSNDESADTLSGFGTHYQENKQKVDLTLFGQHQLTPLLHIGYELYWETYEVSLIAQEYDFTDCTLVVYNKFSCLKTDYGELELYPSTGDAFGGRIDLGARYDFNQTQLTMGYGHSRERYRGTYFTTEPITKFGHHIEVSIYHPWQYGLSTELSLGQVHEDYNGPIGRQTESNKSQWVSFEVKTLVTENTALSLNYTRMNFSDYRHNRDYATWFLHLDYQFSNDKPPRRRKRHNNLMRAL
jgi:hypothetical protein